MLPHTRVRTGPSTAHTPVSHALPLGHDLCSYVHGVHEAHVGSVRLGALRCNDDGRCSEHVGQEFLANAFAMVAEELVAV